MLVLKILLENDFIDKILNHVAFKTPTQQQYNLNSTSIVVGFVPASFLRGFRDNTNIYHYCGVSKNVLELSRPKKWRLPQNKDNFKNEDNLKTKGNCKNEDYLKNENNIKNEDNLKNEDDPKKRQKEGRIIQI